MAEAQSGLCRNAVQACACACQRNHGRLDQFPPGTHLLPPVTHLQASPGIVNRGEERGEFRAFLSISRYFGQDLEINYSLILFV